MHCLPEGEVVGFYLTDRVLSEWTFIGGFSAYNMPLTTYFCNLMIKRAW